MGHLPYGEACRWDYPDIKRARRGRDTRKFPLPRKDANLRELGSGITFTYPDGRNISVQGWSLSPWPSKYWCVVYHGAAFPGEMRLLSVTMSGPILEGARYRPNGRRAHADGSECPCGVPCKDCWL